MIDLKYYKENGYLHIKNFISHAKINDCLSALEEIKKKKQYYFSQSKHKWFSTNNLSVEGFLIESIQHPTKHIFLRKLKNSVKEILIDNKISDLLKSVTGFNYHVRWQDMLFDQSTGTIEHADNWFLDTVPAGYMNAIWIALEDIHEDAGRFYIVKKSNKLKHPDYNRDISLDAYAKLIKNLVDENNLIRYAPNMQKGDVILWNSLTVHGSYIQNNKKFSRKSITAHYYPLGFLTDKKTKVESLKSSLKKLQSTKNPNLFFDNSDPSVFKFMIYPWLKLMLKKFLNYKSKYNGIDMTRKT
jgi:phytanoyl-CoA hydroxylase